MREDWIECEIGDVFDVVTGNTPSKANVSLYGGNIPFIKPPEINNNEVEDASEFLTEEGAKVARILPKFSVLITCIGNLGRVAMNSKFEVAFNQQINALKPNKFVYPKYIFYKAQSSNFRNQLEELSTAVTVALVNKTNFSKVRFPLPPLPEQRAILKKLESLFSSLDAGVADLKKAQQQLKIYRQAVLKKAFEGELILDTEVKLLKNITEKIGSGSTPKGGNENYKTSGIPLVRSLNIHFDYIKFDGLAFIDENQAEKLKNVEVYKDDVLLNITGASIGRVNIAPNEFQGGRVNQHVSIVRLNKEMAIPKFIKYFIQSPEIQGYINNANYGVTRQALTKTMIENMEVPLPTINLQNEIVKQIESRLSVCDSIEQNIKESLEKAEALRQSILKKAFEGNLLTAQELAECKLADDYEPASVLLEKIKAEQTEIKTKPSKKKPRHSVAKSQ